MQRGLPVAPASPQTCLRNAAARGSVYREPAARLLSCHDPLRIACARHATASSGVPYPKRSMIARSTRHRFSLCDDDARRRNKGAGRSGRSRRPDRLAGGREDFVEMNQPVTRHRIDCPMRESAVANGCDAPAAPLIRTHSISHNQRSPPFGIYREAPRYMPFYCGPPPPLWYPGDHLVGIHDVARLAMHAVERGFQPRVPARMIS